MVTDNYYNWRNITDSFKITTSFGVNGRIKSTSGDYRGILTGAGQLQYPIENYYFNNLVAYVGTSNTTEDTSDYAISINSNITVSDVNISSSYYGGKIEKIIVFSVSNNTSSDTSFCEIGLAKSIYFNVDDSYLYHALFYRKVMDEITLKPGESRTITLKWTEEA